MTTLGEAATQALEALENLGMRYYENTGIVLHRDVYESLKSALAEEALQRLTDVSQEIEAALAEPVQEPVAWFHTDFGSLELSRVQQVGWKPLYAAPPQRKPLSETKIEKLLIESAGMTVQFNDVDLHFARAIERAHGIK